MTHTAVITLGSNLEQPIQNIRRAIDAIAALPRISCLQASSLYRSAPVGYVAQPDFINAIAIIETTFTAPELLHALHAIEHAFGRERSFRNAPRTLDLDIIDFAHQISDTPELQLPHPRAHQRGFVMLPLAEIAPDYVIYPHGSARDLSAKLNDQSVIRIDDFQAA